jgi:hypothetical protein
MNLGHFSLKKHLYKVEIRSFFSVFEKIHHQNSQIQPKPGSLCSMIDDRAINILRSITVIEAKTAMVLFKVLSQQILCLIAFFSLHFRNRAKNSCII